ncbi:hypothetical protein EUTSA_v10028707mg [Eutrema salsugineum]|uniref:Replication factor A C-terminal domain-containing protein n=1 Tax=Eutrema salsugineum TaxID=72664 RepID=V4LG37_EUTSA|nr:hypothetical protein EUTSA_v10028707mg [Eutrema salsugineum]
MTCVWLSPSNSFAVILFLLMPCFFHAQRSFILPALRSYASQLLLLTTNLYTVDVIGQLRLISGDNLRSPTTLETAPQVIGTRAKDRLFLHLLMKDGETIRIYLWDKIAAQFRERWNSNQNQPTVLLLTTVNPRTIGGAVTLSSTTSTRLFFDTDLPETEAFMTWLGEGRENLPTVTSSSSAITKLETVTLKEINTFIQNEIPQIASFYCFATPTEVLEQYGWYYISCRCKTKLGKTETSLYCPNCKKTNNVGIIRYRFEISVRDENNDVATFVIFDDDGKKIAGRNATYFLNDSNEENARMPDCLKSIIGGTYKFEIKLTKFNFTATRQTFSVSRMIDGNINSQTTTGIENINVQNAEGDTDPAIGMPSTNTHSKASETTEYSEKRKEKRPRLEN